MQAQHPAQLLDEAGSQYQRRLPGCTYDLCLGTSHMYKLRNVEAVVRVADRLHVNRRSHDAAWHMAFAWPS